MKSQLKRVVLTGAALSAALVAGAISAPAASAAPAAGSSATAEQGVGTGAVRDMKEELTGPKGFDKAGVRVGSIDLAKKILQLVENHRQTDEAGIVQGIRNYARYATDCQKNVVVIKDDHPKKLTDLANTDGSEILDMTVEKQGADRMRLLVFDSGTVVNEGHGGYPNWAYGGNSERLDDSTARFEPIESGGGCG